jgi:hypothetical protein
MRPSSGCCAEPFFCCYVTADPEATWDERALLESSRDVRLLTVEKFPELLDKIVEEARKLSTRTVEQVEHAREIAESLKAEK